MTIDQLIYFLAVAETGHLSHAAENMNISQPALSSSISRLEDELGMKLFDRKGRNIYLNDSGRLFLPYARNAVSAVEQGRRILSDAIRPKDAVILQTANISQYPQLLDAVLSVCEHISMTTSSVPIYELEENLISGKADLCFTTKTLSNSALDHLDVCRESLLLAVSSSSPLASEKIVCPEDMSDQVFVNTGVHSGMYSFYNLVFADLRSKPAINPSAYTFNEAIAYISKGLYAGIINSSLTKTVLTAQRSDIRCIPIRFHDGTSPYIMQRLYWKKGSCTGAVARVHDTISSYFTDYDR